jgi:hypothetical protein
MHTMHSIQSRANQTSHSCSAPNTDHDDDDLPPTTFTHPSDLLGIGAWTNQDAATNDNSSTLSIPVNDIYHAYMQHIIQSSSSQLNTYDINTAHSDHISPMHLASDHLLDNDAVPQIFECRHCPSTFTRRIDRKKHYDEAHRSRDDGDGSKAKRGYQELTRDGM